jgi:hypothetical protein
MCVRLGIEIRMCPKTVFWRRKNGHLDFVIPDPQMREHVDLQVTARGATAVEYTLRAPARATSSWRVLSYLLCIVAAASATSWHSQSPRPPHTWLYLAAVAFVLAVGIHAATGSVVIEGDDGGKHSCISGRDD